MIEERRANRKRSCGDSLFFLGESEPFESPETIFVYSVTYL